MLAHKVDDFRGDVTGSGHKVAFIFPIFIIYHHHQLSRAYVLNGTFNTIQHDVLFAKLITERSNAIILTIRFRSPLHYGMGF
jgi:hypothetical protein